MGRVYSHAANWLTVHYTYKRKNLIRTYRQQLSDLCGLKSLLLVAISVSKRANVLIRHFDSRIFSQLFSLILWPPNYSQNYSGIIGSSLPVPL